MSFLLSLTLAFLGISLAHGAPHDLYPASPKLEFEAKGKPALRIVGKAKLDSPETLKGEVSVTREAFLLTATLLLKSLDTGIALRNKHLTEKYLQTEKWPTATLKIPTTAIAPVLDAPGITSWKGNFTGALTLHGNTKDLKGDYTIELDGDSYRWWFTTEIDLENFAVEPPNYLGVGVGKMVPIRFGFSLDAKSVRSGWQKN